MEPSKNGLMVGKVGSDDMAKFLGLSKKIFGIPKVEPKNVMKLELSITGIKIPAKLPQGEIVMNDCKTVAIRKKLNLTTRKWEYEIVTYCRDNNWNITF
jgi:hypothetical protein